MTLQTEPKNSTRREVLGSLDAASTVNHACAVTTTITAAILEDITGRCSLGARKAISPHTLGSKEHI